VVASTVFFPVGVIGKGPNVLFDVASFLGADYPFFDDDDGCLFVCNTDWLSLFNNDGIATSSCDTDNDDDGATLTALKMVDA
jgi:hypothetical protein